MTIFSITSIVLFLSLIGLSTACAQEAVEPVKADFIFENVKLIPMDEERILADKAVVVRDGVIVSIIDSSEAKRIGSRSRIDGQGRYLMPGLADMHVHLRWDPQTMFDLFLAHGVTTVVNMFIKDGGGRIDHLALRDAVASGQRIGPRYLLAGEHLQDDFPATIHEMEALLDDHAARGYDFIKVHGDLAPEIYDALVRSARLRNLRILGHTQHHRPLGDSLRLDAVEHAEEFLYSSLDPAFGQALKDDFLKAYREHAERLRDPTYRAPIVEAVARSGIYIDPTLIVYKNVGIWASDDHLAALRDDPLIAYIPQETRQRWLNPLTNSYQEEGFPITKAEIDRNLEVLFMLVKDFNDAGVPLLTGTDTFGTLVPGYSIHQELELLVQAGLSPYEALKAGTINVAAYLGNAETEGKIQRDHRADFILLDQNPLADIQRSKSVSGVFTHHQWHDRSTLEALKEKAKRAAN